MGWLGPWAIFTHPNESSIQNLLHTNFHFVDSKYSPIQITWKYQKKFLLQQMSFRALGSLKLLNAIMALYSHVNVLYLYHVNNFFYFTPLILSYHTTYFLHVAHSISKYISTCQELCYSLPLPALLSQEEPKFKSYFSYIF